MNQDLDSIEVKRRKGRNRVADRVVDRGEQVALLLHRVLRRLLLGYKRNLSI